MTAHIAYPRVLGSREPATLSKKFLTEILRNEFKFKGLIMTDAMEMNAISRNFDLGEASVRTILAGTDIVLFVSWGPVVSRAAKKVAQAVREGVIPMARIDESARRIVASKLRYGIVETKNSEIIYSEYAPSGEDRALLARAEAVNREISRKAVSFVGRPGLFESGKKPQRILVSYNDLVTREAAKTGGILCLRGIDAKLYAEIRKQKGKGCLVFYYFHDNQGALAGLDRFCRENGADLVALCSGNPFPVVKSGMVESMIFSFSNTPESLRQLGACAGGAFTPRMNCNLDLGGRR
jgi:beta-glucosidase-like glycosyl hydrolase